SRMLNIAAGLVLACVVAANVLENVVGLEESRRQHEHLAQGYPDAGARSTPAEPTGFLRLLRRLARMNEEGNLVINLSGAIQRWNMFSPDPPKADHWWVADAVLQDGRPIDPQTSQQTDFITHTTLRERLSERIWG